MSVTVHTIYTVASEDAYITVRDTDAVLQTAWDNCRDFNSPDVRWVIVGGDELAATNIVYDLSPNYEVRLHQFYLRFDTAGIADSDDIISVDLYTVARWGSGAPADLTEFRAGTFGDPVSKGNWVVGDDIASHALLATIGVQDYLSTSHYTNADVDQTAMRSHINKTGDTLIMGSVDTQRTNTPPAAGTQQGRTINSAASASYDPKLVVVSGTIDAPFHVRTASRATGYANNMDVDIGEAGNDRLIVVTLDSESKPGATFQGTVTVDGKSFTQAKLAENTDGAGNHLECHTIDEATLGASAGVLNVSYSGGDNSWGMTVDVFYGVKNDTVVDSNVDSTTIGSPVSVSSIDSNDDALVFMVGANGASGTFSGWTAPLTAIGSPNTPSSAVYQTAWGVETTGQTNKTYEVTGPATLRSAGIVMVFDFATTAYDESLSLATAGALTHANQNEIAGALNADLSAQFGGAGQQAHAAVMSVPLGAAMAPAQDMAMQALAALSVANLQANTASVALMPHIVLDSAHHEDVLAGAGLGATMSLAHAGASLAHGALDVEGLVALSLEAAIAPSIVALLRSALAIGATRALSTNPSLAMPSALVLGANYQDIQAGQVGLYPLASFGVVADKTTAANHTIGLFADLATMPDMANLGQQDLVTQADFSANLAKLVGDLLQHGSSEGRTLVVPSGSRTLRLTRTDGPIVLGPTSRNRTRI